MKKYRVNVNGTEYEIAIELIEESEAKASVEKQAAPVSQPAPKQASASPSAGGHPINSPMPGNIIRIDVTQGMTVKKGQVLMILEAMKMENEIMAPADGKVTAILVSKGTAVETGTPLCVVG